ncbi:hypothetical protein SCP_0215040 [Sparassis crispa]|uniref:Uncharacterized protein n=1 Tax=Sparassis crispa TaxID=139825 RepID=A0A401GDT2_9APHY|nr:hypothetical protein SCP_0215040 [Sparassis crispa]GBE80285.1 hypothetical protein SCP_0215040 [Sparassis crispa]
MSKYLYAIYERLYVVYECRYNRNTNTSNVKCPYVAYDTLPLKQMAIQDDHL